jgi:hypothetical protein
MNLYNGKISRRINKLIRTKIVVPTKRRKLEKKIFLFFAITVRVDLYFMI